MRSRFVKPFTDRLPLSDGDWLEVKRELTAGEQRRVFSNVVKTMVSGEKTELNPEHVGKTKILEYVVAWSFVDDKGDPVPFSSSALDGLDLESFMEIMEAVDAHDEKAEKARDERKKARDGRTGSIPTSPSVDSSLVGVTTT